MKRSFKLENKNTRTEVRFAIDEGKIVTTIIPDLGKPEHEHITLTDEDIANLVDFLIDFQNS
jgi:hypothetical protein